MTSGKPAKKFVRVGGKRMTYVESGAVRPRPGLPVCQRALSPLAGLDPAIHAFVLIKTWTRGSSPRVG